LKSYKFHIICSRILLFCFVAGQVMLYAHQHSIDRVSAAPHSISKSVPQQTVQEKCSLCDVMHHNAMVAADSVYFNPVKVISHVFEQVRYSFESIQLILSGGRAPPASDYNS
jgi:hypothetical protein